MNTEEKDYPPLPEQPRNPYEPMGASVGGGARLLPPSTGLDGASLDSLLQARWSQGRVHGHSEGYAEASDQWQRIWENGRDAGTAFAVQLERFRLATSTPQIVDGIRRRLADAHARTGSDEIEQLVSGALEGLDALVAVLAEPGS